MDKGPFYIKLKARLERRSAPPSHHENSGTEHQRQHAQTPRGDS
jgi:hypothetical protein